MSAFNASIWAITFNGTPPQPSVEILQQDRIWESIEQARYWIAHFLRGWKPVHAVFIVGRECNTLVLSYQEAALGNKLGNNPSELEATEIIRRIGTTDANSSENIRRAEKWLHWRSLQ